MWGNPRAYSERRMGMTLDLRTESASNFLNVMLCQ
jgi:hypothetical protein